MRVSIQNLTKRFGDTAVLKDISLEVRDQELFFCLARRVVARRRCCD